GQTCAVRANVRGNFAGPGVAGFDERGARMGWRLLRRRGIYVPRETSDTRWVLLSGAVCSAGGRNRDRSRTPASPLRDGGNRQYLRRSPGWTLLWPFIGDVKRVQAHRVMRTIHGQVDLPRGNPAFGVAGARY